LKTHEVIVHELAQETLKKLFLKDKKSFNKISIALDELEKKGLKASSIKKLSSTNKIFRKRVGRFRILFTVNLKTFNVWIIAIEKDTKKDYKVWIKYITN